MIVLYTTGCPRCKILYQRLLEKQVDFTICDDVEKMIEMGFMEAPVLVVGDVIMNFNQALAWLQNQ